MDLLEHVVMWRRLDLPGHDVCCHGRAGDGWRLTGNAIFAFDGRACHLGYALEADAGWQTRSASVFGNVGSNLVDVYIDKAADGSWCLNGVPHPQTAGCVDIDLGFTPATHLVALRRLALRIGAEADAPAAWLDFPALTLNRLEQRYRRLSRFEYHYAAACAGYVAVLGVDDHGAVVRYPRLWEQERATLRAAVDPAVGVLQEAL